jgi:hypothetical protein
VRRADRLHLAAAAAIALGLFVAIYIKSGEVDTLSILLPLSFGVLYWFNRRLFPF